MAAGVPLGLQALSEMRAADEARGIDPTALVAGPVIQQPAVAPRPFVIEPADWETEARAQDPVPATTLHVTPGAALAELWARDIQNGVNPTDEPPPPPPGPPITLPPLLPVLIPPADWRAEEAEVARRNAPPPEPAPDPEPPPPESLQAQPAKPRKSKKSATPNLDEVRAWRAGL